MANHLAQAGVDAVQHAVENAIHEIEQSMVSLDMLSIDPGCTRTIEEQLMEALRGTESLERAYAASIQRLTDTELEKR